MVDYEKLYEEKKAFYERFLERMGFVIAHKPFYSYEEWLKFYKEDELADATEE